MSADGIFFETLLRYSRRARAPSACVYVAVMKRHETPRCSRPAASLGFFFVFKEIHTAERAREEEEGENVSRLAVRAVYTSAIVARRCIIALIKRYILWTTRYNSSETLCAFA